jgi:ribosomal protein S18 acetylase RimI-like enzyme
MGVHPEYRRLGLGRALLASVLSRFKAEGIGETVIDIGAYNPEAAGLLQSLGFVVTRRLSGYRKLIPQA